MSTTVCGVSTWAAWSQVNSARTIPGGWCGTLVIVLLLCPALLSHDGPEGNGQGCGSPPLCGDRRASFLCAPSEEAREFTACTQTEKGCSGSSSSVVVEETGGQEWMAGFSHPGQQRRPRPVIASWHGEGRGLVGA